MSHVSRRSWIGIFVLLFLLSACNLPASTPPVTQTMLATAQNSPMPDLNLTPPTAIIPVTGLQELVSLRCYFCVNNESHAVLVMPEQATFLVSNPIAGINCFTARVVKGQRIVFCRGPQQAAFTLGVCIANTNCQQLPFVLNTCPVTSAGATPAITPALGASPTPTAAIFFPPLQPSVTVTPGVPASDLHDPQGFIHWYFNTVTTTRNYRELWDNHLTASYKANVGSGVFEDYVGWWNSVERVEITSVEILQNDGTRAWVRVQASFRMRDGRVVPVQPYDYELLYDANRNTWLFDYRQT